MSTVVESRASMSRSVQKKVNTGADTKSLGTADDQRNEQSRIEQLRSAWEAIIDHKLIEWGRDLGQLADDGVDPPTGDTISRAIELAQSWKNAGMTPPQTVVPDANGGIVFERRYDGRAEVLHLWDDGTLEYQQFCGTTLVERMAL